MINKLVEKIKKTGAPIVVGLDPMLNYIPQHVLDKAYAEYGDTLEGAAEAVLTLLVVLTLLAVLFLLYLPAVLFLLLLSVALSHNSGRIYNYPIFPDYS
jgi:hypothetical protein